MRNQLISHEMPAVHPAKKINCMQGDQQMFQKNREKSKAAGNADRRLTNRALSQVTGLPAKCERESQGSATQKLGREIDWSRGTFEHFRLMFTFPGNRSDE
ncbi:uncharacterized protein H6S33_007329 [Morchella sextelata]|uniref:uncharacterized protein n=1 Tax=Morchella sextelata TaxID=1174677 RepID=UPI001D047242|nr:uncharacterized protein H6S33_007329 [Morchella sextelata]KAH0603670.1 hypothetical protein H6S33_007329 [Morchella sextelata]